MAGCRFSDPCTFSACVGVVVARISERTPANFCSLSICMRVVLARISEKTDSLAPSFLLTYVGRVSTTFGHLKSWPDKKYPKRIAAGQRKEAFCVAYSYLTISEPAVLVLVGSMLSTVEFFRPPGGLPDRTLPT